MAKKILVVFSLIILLIIFVGVRVFIYYQGQTTVYKPSGQNEFCDWIKIEAVKTQFCLDKRLVKDYEKRFFDGRNENITPILVGVEITTKDYKESGKIIVGSASWKNFKVTSGLNLSFQAEINPRTKSFDELKDLYLKTFYEPHSEFPPHKGWKEGSVNGLNYVYTVKINDPETDSKGLEFEANFLKNGIGYHLFIVASPKTISEKDFRSLYNIILRTIRFGVN